MISLMELTHRIENGPACSDSEFDLHILYPKINELIKEYKLKYDPTQIVPTDNELIDNYFKAGLELAESIGIYCIDSGRRILFSRREILNAVRAAPSQLTLGEGKDARTMYYRSVEDKRPPFNYLGPSAAPVTEDILIPLYLSYLKSDYTDTFGAAAIVDYYGHQIRTYSPLEIVAAKTNIMRNREALTIAGRSGLNIGSGQSSVTTNLGFLTTTSPQYIRKTDCLTAAILSEMKTDYDRLTKVYHNADYGAATRNLQDPIIGGIAGGPEGAALVGVASILWGLLLHRASYHTIHPVHRKYLATSCRMALWVASIVGQTFARNSHILVSGNSFLAAGPGEKMLLQEVAANAICDAVSGLQMGPGVPSALSKYTNHVSGLESIFLAEAGLATAQSGTTREQANEACEWLLSQYENRLDAPPKGQEFKDVYDLKTIEPKPHWAKMREETIHDLKQFNLEFPE